jgi:CheY-like chemotaxis protein
MTKTILLVEDEDNDVFLMRRAARAVGIENPFRVAYNGQEAIDYLSGVGQYMDRLRFPVPCVILLDLKLPRVMGLEVLKWIREQPELRTVVVIVVSSSSLDSDIQTAYRLGANSYLIKPCTYEQLSEMMTGIKLYWLDLNQPRPEFDQRPRAREAGAFDEILRRDMHD